MIEPVETELFEVLDSKGAPRPGLSLERRVPPVPGKVPVGPWFPEIVFIPSSLCPAFRSLFPAEAQSEKCEAKVLDAIGPRHVIALYGQPPKQVDPPAVVEEEPAPAAERGFFG